MTNSAVHKIGHESTKRESIFGTDGIRGNAKTLFNPKLVVQIGYCSGLALQKNGPVIIGHDTRESCSMITSALTAGLTAAGREVWLLGLCPTQLYLFL